MFIFHKTEFITDGVFEYWSIQKICCFQTSLVDCSVRSTSLVDCSSKCVWIVKV